VVVFEDLEACLRNGDDLAGVHVQCGPSKLMSPVWAATLSTAEDVLEKLLSVDGPASTTCCAQVDEYSDESACRPMHCAAKFKLHDGLAALVRAGADVNSKNDDLFGLGAGSIKLLPECGGRTPLHLLGFGKEDSATLQSCRLLLGAKADLHLRDYLDLTAHDIAVTYGNTELAELLELQGAHTSASRKRPQDLTRLCKEREEDWKVKRRQTARADRQKMMAQIGTSYIPKVSRLYSSDFLSGCCRVPADGDDTSLVELTTGVFGLHNFFSSQDCAKFMDELDSFTCWADQASFDVARPNSMNRYGMVLGDVGFQASMHGLMRTVIEPLARRLFPAQFSNAHGEEKQFLSQHSFIVRYKAGEDINLKTHKDDSDFTLNLCLGRSFEGADVFFHESPGQSPSASSNDRGDEYAFPHPDDCKYCVFKHEHTPGMALLHLGRHVHGVNSLRSGERMSLIVWCRFRPYPEELAEPFAVPVFSDSCAML